MEVVCRCSLLRKFSFSHLIFSLFLKLNNLLNYIKNFTSFIMDGKLFGFIDKDLVCLHSLDGKSSL